jgi:MFS family permease
MAMSAPGSAPVPEPAHDPYAALRNPTYRYYICGQVAALFGGQILSITVGWELYQRTNSKLALGLVGLMQVLPVITLFLPAGHLVDRIDRRKIILTGSATLMLTSFCLGLASFYNHSIPDWLPLHFGNHLLRHVAYLFNESGDHFNDPQIPLMYFLLFMNGCIRAVNQPARQSLMPSLVAPEAFANAVTWNSTIMELCSIVGPTAGGFLIAGMTRFLPMHEKSHWVYATSYFVCCCLQLVQWVTMAIIKLRPIERAREKLSAASLLAGITFVKNTKILLATMTLDLFAVLLGGAVALLPVYAHDILHVGPTGFGWLRAAPSIGAVTMALIQAHRPPTQRAGPKFLIAVAGFGVATIVFGLSTSFWLSLIALIATGVFDNISVIVRSTLVLSLTPDNMRGRVSSVNSVFINCSNELGAFESGTTAALFGTVPATVGGGVGTVLCVIASVFLWPQLARLRSLAPPPEESPLGLPLDPDQLEHGNEAAVPDVTT